MRSKSRLAILATMLAAVLALPASASAQIEQFSLSPEVQLGPEGASATATLTFQCAVGLFPSWAVTVVQNTGGRLALGSGEGGLDSMCTGEPETRTALVRFFPPFALKQGKATATATLHATNPDTFEMFSADIGPVAVRVRKN